MKDQSEQNTQCVNEKLAVFSEYADAYFHETAVSYEKTDDGEARPFHSTIKFAAHFFKSHLQ